MMILLPSCPCCASTPPPPRPCTEPHFCSYSLVGKSPAETGPLFLDDCFGIAEETIELGEEAGIAIDSPEGFTQDFQSAIDECRGIDPNFFIPTGINLVAFRRRIAFSSIDMDFDQVNWYTKCVTDETKPAFARGNLAVFVVSIKINIMPRVPAWIARIEMNAYASALCYASPFELVPNVGGSNDIFRSGSQAWIFSAYLEEAEIPCNCSYDEDRHCPTSESGFLFQSDRCHVPTPTTISVSTSGTSLGEWDITNNILPVPLEFEGGSACNDFVDNARSTLEGFTFEFDIISRESCNPAP